MCEIVKSNLKEKLPLIEAAIRNADFIAFDTEFSGLTASDNEHNSLFDTPEIRYCKLRKSVSQLTVTQFGLSAFKKDTSAAYNNYLAQTFNFYLFPTPFGPLDPHFVFQASAGQFLAHYKFDFNKVFYEGIPFLNENQENLLKQYLENPQKFSCRADFEHESHRCCSVVAKWLVGTDEKNEEQESLLVDIPAGVTEFSLLLELRNRFPQLWISASDGKIKVSKILTEEQKQEFEENKSKELRKYLDENLGFTQVFRLLVKYRKPLVGHNILMDLSFMYEKFYKVLPKSYTKFKADLHELFPIIIDTKRLSISIKPIFEHNRLFDKSALMDLYNSLKTLHTNLVVLYPPVVKHHSGSGFEEYNDTALPHQAGYDAYMCGTVLILTAHLLASSGLRSDDMRPLLFREYLSALRPYCNLVNVIRASSNVIRLDGPDPQPLNSSQWLYIEVQSTPGSKTPVAAQLADLLSQFGNIDIQVVSKTGAIVVAGNPKCAKDVLQTLRGNKNFYVAKYSAWRHGPWSKTAALWIGGVTCGCISVGLLWSVVTKLWK